MPQLNPTCFICNTEIEDDEHDFIVMHRSEEVHLCAPCYEDRVTCESCGIFICGDEVYGDDNNNNYCECCYDRIFAECYVCGGTYIRDEMYHDGSFHYYCEEHEPTIGQVGEPEEIEHETDSERGRNQPSPIHPIPVSNPSTPDSDFELTVQYNSDNRNGLLNYHYKPVYYILKRDKESDPLTIGVELEIEQCGSSLSLQSAIKSIHNSTKVDGKKHPFLYCKRDGSLNNGIEVVSMPFTWKWYRINRNMFSSYFNLAAREYSATATDDCGMHVHMSKKHFSSVHLYKFLSLFYDEKNRDFIYRMSGRSHIDYMMRWAGTDENEKRVIAAMCKTYQRTDRHTAVNIHNQKTIEIRVFNGTHTVEVFEKNVEFCLAAYEFTKQSSLNNIKDRFKLHHTHHVNFLRFLNLHPVEYPNLYVFCKKFYKTQMEGK